MPIDEQFLISTRWVDWSSVASILLGGGVMGFALHDLGWQFDLLQAAAFVVMFLCGVAMAYSFLLLLTSTSVWMIRNQNLMELWWLFTTLMRYPREIYQGRWGLPFGMFFTFVVPVGVVASLIGILVFNRKEQPVKAFLSSSVYLFFMLAGACWGLYPTLLPATANSGPDITLERAISGPHTLAVGLAWWTFGMALAVGYVVFVYSRFRGKADAAEGGH